MSGATKYKGIDYSSGRSNVDKNGNHHGVISQHSVMPEAMDDVTYTYGQPEPSECPECGVENKVAEWGDTAECQCGHAYEVELPDGAEPTGWHYKKEGYVLCDCLDSDIFVLESPYYTYAQFCSPCVPGAGNLDSPFDGPVDGWADAAVEAGFPKTLCLGHDWFEGGTAPYPVFSVETNQPVLP